MIYKFFVAGKPKPGGSKRAFVNSKTMRAAVVERVDATAIYARDGGRCHVCGKKVKRARVSLDHLLPLSKGGAHAPWNVRLAHRHCNSQRYNTGSAQLLLAL